MRQCLAKRQSWLTPNLFMYPFCSPFVFMSSHNDAGRDLRKVKDAFCFIQGLGSYSLGFSDASETTKNIG
jgi:hypothetical protein